MPNFEDQTCAFIVRFWLERRESDTADVELRGVVEHVPSGQRHYVRRLGDVATIMSPYLKGMHGSQDEW